MSKVPAADASAMPVPNRTVPESNTPEQPEGLGSGSGRPETMSTFGGLVLPTPGQAVGVGFLFIPWFNCYWIFVATVGLIVRVNRLLRDRLKDGQAIHESVAIPYSALAIGTPLVFSIADYVHPRRNYELPDS